MLAFSQRLIGSRTIGAPQYGCTRIASGRFAAPITLASRHRKLDPVTVTRRAQRDSNKPNLNLRPPGPLEAKSRIDGTLDPKLDPTAICRTSHKQKKRGYL